MDYGGLVGQVEGWRTAGAQIQGSKMKGTMVVKRRAWWQAVQRKIKTPGNEMEGM